MLDNNYKMRQMITEKDEIVISGFSGRFPESDNMKELRDNLMEKRDMITTDTRRWDFDHPQVPKMMGKIRNLEKFDAVFFGIHPKQADAMDPQSRMLLEHTYEAIVDAGVNPKQLRGTKTGVFVGTTFCESEKTWLYEEQESGLGLAGVSRAMFCNRISHWLDLVGPSFTLDAACSSSLTALEQAYRSIRDGYCDAAIVGGSILCLQPFVSMQTFKLGSLTLEGRCRTWDQSADGYVRSEAVSVAFLQRAKDAKRIYATIAHGKINCDGYKPEGISFPSRSRQSALFRELYEECGVAPSSVGYFEAHGTGTRAGDSEEVAAIDEVLGRGRLASDGPLLIGSVKSNLGHTEPASGLVSVAKVLLAMETGIIPPNLHFENCRDDLKAVLEGRMKVVTEPTPWKGEYAAINSFGIGGTNAHVLLRINSKEKSNNGAPDDDLPRLVVVSGRTADAVEMMLRDLESKPVDVEQLALLYGVHSDDVSGHLHRGYTILPSRGIATCPIPRQIDSISGARRPVWFIFSGIGSQWLGMGRALLRLPLFDEVARRCDSLLKPHGVDLLRLMSEDDDETIFDSVVNCFVGIAVVQIGLVDQLKSLKIHPDGLIGHSVGELGCAYADGSLTAEQTILAAYHRGVACARAEPIAGCMAAVGLGHEDARRRCPDDVEVACHNSPDGSTVSGPVESVRRFVAELQTEGIFAKEVACGGVPYHSRYISAAGPHLLSSLQKVIPSPKPRGHGWKSTSLEMRHWNSELASSASAEYFVNNLLSPVLFVEALSLVPNDAIVIEVAPHGLLQGVLKRSLPSGVTSIALTRRGDEDNLEVFLKGVGRMFNAGLQPQVDKLYPPVAFPVSRGTPMISPMIRWQHKDDWFVSYFKNKETFGSGLRVVNIDVEKAEFQALAHHVLGDRIVLPAASYLVLIWETFARMRGKKHDEVPVAFENVQFLRETVLPTKGNVELTLMIQKGTGNFEVIECDVTVASGTVRSVESHSEDDRTCRQSNDDDDDDDDEEYMSSVDVYKEFKLRGHRYDKQFRSLSRLAISGTKARVFWRDDWTSFVDGLLQLMILGHDCRESLVPKAIGRISIDPRRLHRSQVGSEIEAHHDGPCDVAFSGGVEIVGLQVRALPREKSEEPLVEEYKFVALTDESETSAENIARLAASLVVENDVSHRIRTVEFVDDDTSELSTWISKTLDDTPSVQATDVKIVRDGRVDARGDASLVVGRRDRLELMLGELKPGGFALTRETRQRLEVDETKFHVVMVKRSGDEIFALLRRRNYEEEMRRRIVVVEVRNYELDWVDHMREVMTMELKKRKADDIRIVLVGQDGYDNGLLGFVNCLRQEPGGEIVRGILIQDTQAPTFSTQNEFYARQLEKDLAVCVLRENGVWGTYRHLPLSPRFEVKPVYHCRMTSDSTWTEGPLRPDDENLVEIVCASVVFGNAELHIREYSGTDRSKNRLMGVIESSPLSNVCIADPALTWPIPDAWSFEDAATVPWAYATCCYALYLKGRLTSDDVVLIHATSNGFGIDLAAINLALTEGCRVLVAASTPETRRLVGATFPSLEVTDSRGIRRWIAARTNGRGVDLVLNFQDDPPAGTFVDCLAEGGRLVRIGRYDARVDANVMIHVVALDAYRNEKTSVRALFDEFLRRGAIKPLPRAVRARSRANEALDGGEHASKVLIRMRDDEEMTMPTLAVPRYHCMKDRSYVVLGGLGGLGLELCNWLVTRGAKNLVIASRSGIRNAYQSWRVSAWRKRGVAVIVHRSNETVTDEVVEVAAKLAPVDGIFNLAVVLQGALWYNQTRRQFERVLRPKAWLTRSLDEASRRLCPMLRHFVVFSSVSCRGVVGLADYAMANSVTERICERRINDGLPALAVQWGPVGDVGVIADLYNEDKRVDLFGTRLQSVDSCLRDLDRFLMQRRPVVASTFLAGKKIVEDRPIGVVDVVRDIMCFKDLTGIGLYSSLSELGLDSLMAVDIKHSFERDFQIFLTAEDIRGLTFAKLQDMAKAKDGSGKEKERKGKEEIMTS